MPLKIYYKGEAIEKTYPRLKATVRRWHRKDTQ